MDDERLAAFATLARSREGVVADLGCGPGHVVDHLTGLGLTVVGHDLSPGQLAQARAAFPDLTFRLGDLTAPDAADSSLAGILSRYSLIHMTPDRLPAVFERWYRALKHDAPLLVAFFAASGPDIHGTAFDHGTVLCRKPVTTPA